MRLLLVFLILLLAGCTSIEDLTRRSCMPSTAPVDVVLRREAWLYHVDGEREITLWDTPMRGNRFDAQGHETTTTVPPLYALPPGSRLRLLQVTRKTVFDNEPNTIEVRGVAHVDGRDVPFVYDWGSFNRVIMAPWESGTYDARQLRPMECSNNGDGPH